MSDVVIMILAFIGLGSFAILSMTLREFIDRLPAIIKSFKTKQPIYLEQRAVKQLIAGEEIPLLPPGRNPVALAVRTDDKILQVFTVEQTDEANALVDEMKQLGINARIDECFSNTEDN